MTLNRLIGLWTAAVIGFSMTLIATPQAMAEELVINGKKYERNSDGQLFPMIRVERIDTDGVLNVTWLVDYSHMVVNEHKPANLQVRNPNLSVHNPNLEEHRNRGAVTANTNSQGSAITVRDAGSKHYITIGADVLFQFDRADLTPKAQQILQMLGPMLAKYGNHPVVIEGHTDSVGSDEYNQTLSEKRANAVKEWLSSRAFISAAISARGCGESQPVAPNTYNDGTDFPQGRAKNRRVELFINTAE